MFPKDFTPVKGYVKKTHNFISFHSQQPARKVTKKIQELGIAKFLIADEGDMSAYSRNVYHDERIHGIPTLYINNQCCSATKSQRWYLYPLHPTELAAIGLTEDDLIKYIKFLNDLKCGFNYLYFGLQSGGSFTNNMANNTYSFKHSNEFYWVGVAHKNQGEHYNYYYCHWIHLRYLINSTSSSSMGLSNGHDTPYYLFPRIMFYLHEVKKLPKWKAFMFTYASNPWYYYYALLDGSAIDRINTADLGLKPSDFKQLLNISTRSGNMNSMLTPDNEKVATTLGIKIDPHHVQNDSCELWRKGKIDEFIAYMKKCYPTRKTDISKAKVITSGKKKTTKRKQTA